MVATTTKCGGLTTVRAAPVSVTPSFDRRSGDDAPTLSCMIVPLQVLHISRHHRTYQQRIFGHALFNAAPVGVTHHIRHGPRILLNAYEP